MNHNSIFSYIPLTPRVVVSNPEHMPILAYFMTILDAASKQELDFNHTPELLILSINPEQVNDLAELTSLKPIDMADLRKALDSLIYPVFRGNHDK